MSKSRTHRPNTKSLTKSKFLRSISRMFFVSKPVMKNPKFDPEHLTAEPMFIVAPIRGRSYVKPKTAEVSA